MRISYVSAASGTGSSFGGIVLTSRRTMRTRAAKLIVTGMLMFLLCPITGLPSTDGIGGVNLIQQNRDMRIMSESGDPAYAASGASQIVSMNGAFTNDTQELVLMDSSAATPVSIHAPQGWTGTALSGTLEHLSTQFTPIQNGLLDLYHTERTIIAGSPWNAQEYNVPDDWAIVEEGEAAIHPYYGRLFFHSYSSSGREGSMGWRFSASFGTTNALNPSMQLHLRQHVGVPYRELYSAEISINYYVRSVSTMNDYFYLFIRFGDYVSKLHVFQSGYTTEQWLQYTVQVPMSAFDSYPVPGALDLDIGIGTDYSGLPSTTIDNQLYIDEVDLVLEARPLPEQIGFSANHTAITGSVSGSFSQYVPDGASRDCRSRSSTGISTTTYLEVGVSGTAWDNVIKYQVGIQFPLSIPRGAVITYAAVEVEALYDNGLSNGALRVYVAQEDDVTPFTSGLPALENRYGWGKAGVAWILDGWQETLRYRSPDLSSLVQSVVSRSGWDSGNYICIMIDYLNSADYADTVEMKGSWSSSGDDLPTLYVDYVIPQEEDSISVFQYKKDLTIDHTKVGSDLENFPVLVDIYDADLKTDAQPDGDDIRFMIGSKALAYEIEVFDQDYNSSHAHLTAWVSVPELSSSVDTVIDMYYGSETATGIEATTRVWGDVYESVWHFTEPSGKGSYIEDSAGRTHDGLPLSTIYAANSVISSGRQFQDASYMTVIEGDEIFNGWGDWYMSFWLYIDIASDAEFEATEPRILYKSNSMWLARLFRMSGWPAGTGVFQVDVNFAAAGTRYHNVGVMRQTWNYIVMKYESSGDGALHLYSFIDGALADSSVDGSVGTGDQLVSDSSDFTLGSPQGGTIDGIFDEFRLVNGGYRSMSWIETEYTNQYDPASFLSVGTEQSMEYGESAQLLFTTDAPFIVSFLPRLTLNITTQKSTLDANMQPGTSFSVANDTASIWTANVLVSPPPGVTGVDLTVEKPSLWTLLSVIDSMGRIRTSEATASTTQVIVASSVVDTYGVWSFNFTSSNDAYNLECKVGPAPYDVTTTVVPGEEIYFRAEALIFPGSAMRLTLIEPSGQVFYALDDLSQSAGGVFDWSNIPVDDSWPRGLWTVYVKFNDTAGTEPEHVGFYSREFTVKHSSSLAIQSPGDAIGDLLSVKTAGDLLLVEVHLTDTDTSESIAGSTVTMNWTVSGAPTQVQLEDYGDGLYGKALNTSDLGLPGMWRVNIQSSHPYLVDSSMYFDLALSHPTYITYESPEPTPYGDDFTLKLTLYDAINGNPYPSASITSNGTIVGIPVDYVNGTYLVQVDTTGLELGLYCFRFDAAPSQSFVLGSSVDVVFAYSKIRTELVQLEVSPISVPWGRTVNATVEWADLDHGGAGIDSGLLTGDALFQYTDLLDGTYSIEIDVSTYLVGTYLFNFSISRPYYFMGQITIAVSVVPHRVSLVVGYNSSVPIGTNTYLSLAYYDLDSGNTPIPGNFSSVQAQWSGGSSLFGATNFWLQTEGWALGPHTLNLTLFTTASPRFYYDASTAVIIQIRKVKTDLTWTPIDNFPVGDDFQITLYLTVNDSVSKYDGDFINGLDVGYFDARDKDGTSYTIKGLSFLGNGEYLLTIDQAFFSADSYTIRIIITFGATENFTNAQTPIISFVFSQARCELTSPDYPTKTISYSTDAEITLEFVDIDRGQGIDTATVSVIGASKISEDWISEGRYRIVIDTSSWTIGVYTVNLTVSAPGYDSKTISIEIRVREIRTYAIATVGFLDIPLGDSRVFYVEYKDMDHDSTVYPATGLCNWTVSHYDIEWTGTRWMVTINTYDTDILGTYLLMFNFSAGAEFEIAYFNVSVAIRTIQTELRLVTPASPTTASGQIRITVYYGDRDHGIGIVGPEILCTVRNSTDTLSITFTNQTPGTPDGYYLIVIDASQFGGLGSQQLTIIFNWTGSIQKYQDKFILTTAEIIGEDTELILYHATPATPCLGYMNYTFIYLDSAGHGIINSTFNVHIYVLFEGVSLDYSSIDIWEVDSTNQPGYYSIGFNNTILGKTGLFSMKVFINWSQNVWPYYTNRTDVISIRVLPRDTLLSIMPPTSVPYGENATFSFTFEDVTGGISEPIQYDVAMEITLSLAEFSIFYDSLENIFTISFNTSQFGSPIGERSFTLSVTWSGMPFYANKTGRVIYITVTYRQTTLAYPTPSATAYGDNVTFTITLTDVAGSEPFGVESVSLNLYDGAIEIPQSYMSVTALGQGQYLVSLNTSYYTLPGYYELTVVIAPNAFYYKSISSSRMLSVASRQTILIADPPDSAPYNTTLRIVVQYLDLNTLDSIGNESSLLTSIEILNGTGWILSCQWRPSMQNYLLIVETYNQILTVGTPYLLWLNLSCEYKAPFYKWADILVPFQIRERDTSLHLISAALPTPFNEFANFTIEYSDVLSHLGITGANLFVYNGPILLIESVDYHLTLIGVGRYRVSIDTSILGAPGTKLITVIANWSLGVPFYSESYTNVSFTVTIRPTTIEVIKPPSRTQFLDNVTFEFVFKDLGTGQAIGIVADDISIFSGGLLLSPQDYTIAIGGTSIQVSLNSTIISGTLVSGWNITLVVTWPGGSPYYSNNRVAVLVTTISRIGIVELDQVMDTPFGDNVTLVLSFTDQAREVGIEGASISLFCVEQPGLLENSDYWVIAGIGPEAGTYTIEISSLSLGDTGYYNFIIDVSWDSATAPFYQNVTDVQIDAFVRAIQVSLSSDLPTPSVAAFYQNISFTISATDIDHLSAIVGAEGAISLMYGSTGLEPSIWSVSVVADGVYSVSVNLTDNLAIGLQYIIVNVTLFPYQSVETQVVFGVRNRIGGLSADVLPANYAGDITYVTVYLTDEDSGGAPQSGATLVLGWGDSTSYVDLGDGRYNVTLFTGNLEFGVQVLTINAVLNHFSISPLILEIELLAVTSDLIVTLTGPRPNAPLEIYWGEPVTIFAAMNDTLRNQLVTSVVISYSWSGGSGVFEATGMLGNYTTMLDTSQGSAHDAIVVTIIAQAPNYLNATAQISFQLLPRQMEIIPDQGQYVFSVDWGGQATLTVSLKDSINSLLVSGANITASWDYGSLALQEIPGQSGYYSATIQVLNASFGTYEIQLHAWIENFRNTSATLIMSVSQIHLVLWLDSVTASYEYTPVYWSELVRIGVYVLAPSLNQSDPYSAGLSNCIVTWFSPELGQNGTLLNGSLIGGPGYYYFDFNTTRSTASVHTFRLSVTPPNSDYTDAENSTTILVQNLPTTILSEGSHDLIWGWEGHIDFTFLSTFHGVGVEANIASYFWAGGSGNAVYFGNGTYGVPFDTQAVRPGLYRLTIIFRKDNYNDQQLTVAVRIAAVPTEIILNLPEEYRVGTTWTRIQVPYGDILNVILLYNNTWSNSGIAGALFTGSYFSGPGFFEVPLNLTDYASGNYSFVFDSTIWDLYSEFSFSIKLALENHTTATMSFLITIIEIPTTAEMQGPSVLSLSYSNETTFWVFYSDSWPSHDGVGISGADVTIINEDPSYVLVEYLGEDTERPGWYQFRVAAFRITGFADISIVLNKTYYAEKTVHFSVSVSPSQADIAMQNMFTYGSAFIIILLLSSIVWVRIIKVPKQIRTLSSQIRQLRRGRVPKPATDVRNRQEIIAQLFRELCGDLRIIKTPGMMPAEPISISVPEIEQLLLDLAILTSMAQEEVDEFRRDLSKMKMSQQTNFVAEVIKQEVLKVARNEGKSIEEVLENVRLERQERLGQEAAPTTIPGFDIAEEQAALFAPSEVPDSLEEQLNEKEIHEMREALLKRGLPLHEVDAVVAQARKLPREVAETLLKSFGHAVDMHEPDVDTAKLSDMEIEMLRVQLMEEGAKPQEIDVILEQAREVPRALAMELLKGFRHERESRKEPDVVETMSEDDLVALRGRLFIKGTPEEEIEAILEQARKVPKDLAAEFLKEVEEQAPVAEEEVQFEDRLSELELEDLREELKKRNLPPDEIEALVSQAKNLPSALVKDLLDSIDAEEK